MKVVELSQMRLLEHIKSHNDFSPEHFVPLVCHGALIGLVECTLAEQLSEEFRGLIKDRTVSEPLTIVSRDWQEVTKAFEAICQVLYKNYSVIPCPRKEKVAIFPYERVPEILSSYQRATNILRGHGLFQLDRNGCSPFGVATFGVMLNCYTRNPKGDISIWVAERSLKKPAYQYPGKLDTLVGGGIDAGSCLPSTLVNEAWDECSLPASLVRNASYTGYVSYLMRQHRGVKNQVLFSFDLELPFGCGWLPKKCDGSVEDFFLIPAEEVADLLRYTDVFKGGSNLIIMDFLLRHGIIKPSENGYDDIRYGLRRQLTFKS